MNFFKRRMALVNHYEKQIEIAFKAGYDAGADHERQGRVNLKDAKIREISLVPPGEGFPGSHVELVDDMFPDVDETDCADVPMALIDELREAVNEDDQLDQETQSTVAAAAMLKWLDTH